MALNIKNPEVERLATEVAQLARETKTEAIRRALEERKARSEGQSDSRGEVSEDHGISATGSMAKHPAGSPGKAPHQAGGRGDSRYRSERLSGVTDGCGLFGVGIDCH